MGVFSKYHRYREAGKEANVVNVERFGEPVSSLFTSKKIIDLHHSISITDAQGNVRYKSRSKVISLRDKTDITDGDGKQVAHIEKKIFSLHERHYITMADGKNFELSNELLHIIKDITNIEGLGWQLRGNIAALNFELYDENDKIIALFSQKLLSLHDKYCVDIYQPQYEQYIVAILVTLQHMINDRESSAAAASSSSSSAAAAQ